MGQTLLVAGILIVAAILSAAITGLVLKAVKLLFRIIVFIVIFAAAAFLLLSLFTAWTG